MKLGKKLVIMSIFTILIPMLIIVLYAAFMIYQSSAISQWEYLEGIQTNLEKDLIEAESAYLKTVKRVAESDFIRAKLYVYEKYWTRLSERLIAYDLEPVNDYLEEVAQLDDIEVITLYRRFGNTFNPVATYGESRYRPDVLYKDLIQSGYNKISYKRYPDGIYLDVIYPVFSEGKLVGLVQFMHGYNAAFLEKYSKTYGIGYTLVSKNAVISSSSETVGEIIKNIVAEEVKNSRISFRSGSSTYSGVVLPFNLGGDAYGDFILFSVRANLFGNDSFLIQRLIAITLLCIMIPVVTFFIKEMRLINSINSLLAATDAISGGNYKIKVNVASGDEMGMLSSNFNKMVSVLKENREELERQNAELSMKNSYIDAVFQSLRINIVVIDPERRIKVISKNASSRLELTEEQYGRDILTVEPFVQVSNLIEKTIEEIFTIKKFSRLYSVKFGETSFEMDFYPVIEENRSVGAVVIILNNITERMDIERALMHSDRLASVGQMAAGLAHEINNPMSIILNHVQLIQSDRLAEDERERFLIRIESEIKRVSKLINNLLKFSRDETLSPENIQLGEVLTEITGLFDPKASAENVEEFYNGIKSVNLPASRYIININGHRICFYITGRLAEYELVTGRDSLKQVLFNIMKNAFESCDSDECIIWADVEHVHEATKLRLTDNGCGISENEQMNVFELFYTRGKPGTGVGLGLPLCRRLMNNLGGEIGINSRKGEGTTVTLLFPDREGFYGKTRF